MRLDALWHRERCMEEQLAGNGGPGMPWDNACGDVDRRQGRNTEQRCRELYRDCGRQGYKQPQWGW